MCEIKLSFCRFICQTDDFEINGIKADSDDFGHKYNDSPG